MKTPICICAALLMSASAAQAQVYIQDYVSPEAITGTGERIPVKWLGLPSTHDLIRVYPRRALENGVSGEVRMNCHPRIKYGMGDLFGCRVTSERPFGYGFSGAALSLSEAYRAYPTRRLPPNIKPEDLRVFIVIHWMADGHSHVGRWAQYPR